LLEICQTFFGWQGDQLTPNDFEAVWRLAENKLKQPDWEQHIWQQTNLQQIYLTNEFDDPLIGFKTDSYIPCLRVDTLVNTAHEPATLERLRHASGHVVNTVGQLHNAIASLVQQFRNKGARACAISLPSRFRYQLNTSDRLPATAPLLNLTPTQQVTLKAQVFHAIAEQCNVHGLPFDLMIGVQRNVYPSGVYQGQDLMDEPGSLLHYAELFNSFPDVKFCVSVLTSQQNQELASYSWIFPNVYTSGHWWYSNVPTLIEQDLRLRLQAVPVEKQIGYYSDAYKLEFVLPKFNMYRRILAKVLAEDYVLARHWPEERAVALGEQLLVGNIHSIFGN
ncbi:MAG TPA: glucuronate isomerase, partial [Gemmatales bacterium]|nr:glucuronate isomerase [Gemmatales bacterium]